CQERPWGQGYLRRLTRRLTEDLEQRDVEELSESTAIP
ncbi:hypothetical protein BA28_02528, partial [Mycobacterium tuberculosis NRITLD12]